LNRYLNVPPARLPPGDDPQALLTLVHHVILRLNLHEFTKVTHRNFNPITA
jgi:hypothetical protein